MSLELESLAGGDQKTWSDNANMRFPALGEFVRYLESIGELRRISTQVDPYLEITEIATRAMRERKPALLFENVKGSSFPLAINVYG
jgi:4-hydroxy-3-polyprenylbenzoate decarboxylase